MRSSKGVANTCKQRVVPVTLRAGKKYVLGNGTVVTIEANPHWQLNKEWPWQAVRNDLGAEPTYFKDNGRSSWMSDDLMNIARPVYEVGGRYLSRDGRRAVFIESDDRNGNSSTSTKYPLNGAGFGGGCFTVDGFYLLQDEPHECDLLDYAPDEVPLPERRTTAPEYIGKRVRSVDGFMGTVVLDFGNEYEDGNALIKYDDPEAGNSRGRFLGRCRRDCISSTNQDHLHQWVTRGTLVMLLCTDDEPIKLAGKRAVVAVHVDEILREAIAVKADPILPPLPSPYIQEEDVASVVEASEVEQYLTAALDEGMKLNPSDMQDVWHVYATTMRDIGDIIAARIALRLASM